MPVIPPSSGTRAHRRCCNGGGVNPQNQIPNAFPAIDTFWVCQIQILVFLVFLNFSDRNFVWWDSANYLSSIKLWKNSEAIFLWWENSWRILGADGFGYCHYELASTVLTPDPNYWRILFPSTFSIFKNSDQKSRKLRLLKILWNVRLQINFIEYLAKVGKKNFEYFGPTLMLI